MDRRELERALGRGCVYGSILGALSAIVMIALFGFADVQCRNSHHRRYWNAERQSCQASEVRDSDGSPKGGDSEAAPLATARPEGIAR